MNKTPCALALTSGVALGLGGVATGTLTGSAGSADERNLAEHLAREIGGAVGVSNQIALGAKPAVAGKAATMHAHAEAPVSEAWITSKETSSLMFTRGVDSLDIPLTAVDGVASLSDTVDSTAEREWPCASRRTSVA